MTRFILVRHGETEWNRVERFRGRADVALNGSGRRQAEATARRLSREKSPAAVYCSPLSRALATAETIAGAVGRVAQVQEGLADIDYGRWQGLSPAEVAERWPEAHRAWFYAPHTARIPGGETLAQVRERAMGTVRRLAGTHPDASVVLVGHTVVNRIILLGILGLGNERFWRLGQDTCAINVFTADGEEFTLVRLNDTCHLDGVL